MSPSTTTLTEHKTKKRKHGVAVSGAGEPSTKRSKIDGSVKDVPEGNAATAKAKEKKKKDKGKSRASDGQFRVVQASMAVSVPPVFANDLRAGVEEMLDSMVMRYIPALQGVVLAHDNLHFLDSRAAIKADCPFANCRVGFDATVWSPHVGMKLVGKVNLCSPDHVSLLVHRTFNVSIPRHHIPTDHWEFEYGPAENDPEFGAGAATTEGEEKMDEGAGGQPDVHVEGSGSWVHKVTATKLGGREGYLEFTVVGLTIANQMLSLVGSIQPDPFSPEHVPTPAVTSSTQSKRQATESVWGAVQAEDEDALPNEVVDSEDEDDAFGMLGRMGDEAAAKAAERRAKEAEEAKKERKRKRKEAKMAAAEGAAEGQDDLAHEKKKKKKKS